ncbi:MAG: hypothetical protein OEY01_11390 [Desulfobulbaceae bacterium]|nr:hypothetical protein [Desulfobulbaceae bacterium]HIJ79454.1 hypothetical protein [Deltaproteobacteria bacterium]
MNSQKQNPIKVLIVFYSLSAQTSGLVHRLASGLADQGIGVVMERLKPLEPLKFPLGSIPATLSMMFSTFLRRRIAIEALSPACWQKYDLLIVAGPTWSYNPSGPILSMLERDGAQLFAGKKVVPLISCRGYWRTHWFGLRRLLQQKGAEVLNKIVFTHPSREPWRTIGVFLKLAGKMPEKAWLIGRYYQHFGHAKAQKEEAYSFGVEMGKALQAAAPLADLDLHSKITLE